jgi:hypothetical protein
VEKGQEHLLIQYNNQAWRKGRQTREAGKREKGGKQGKEREEAGKRENGGRQGRKREPGKGEKGNSSKF